MYIGERDIGETIRILRTERGGWNGGASFMSAFSIQKAIEIGRASCRERVFVPV